MSGGKSFALVDKGEKTPEDRLNILEQMIPVLIQKIQAYDKIIDDFKVLKKSQIDISEICNKNTQSIEIASSFMKNYNDQCQSMYKITNSTISSQNAKFEDFSKDLIRFKSDQNDLVVLINKIDDKYSILLQKLTDSCVTRSEFEEQNNFVESKLKSIQSSFSNIHNELERLDNQVVLNLNKNTEFSVESKSTKDFIEQVQEKIRNLHSLNNTLKQDFYNSLIVYTNSINEDVSKRFSNFKIELKESPDSSNSIKSEIISKLDSVALDGSNALLKASNSAQQISILEKKIENIYLLLKKFEINK